MHTWMLNSSHISSVGESTACCRESEWKSEVWAGALGFSRPGALTAEPPWMLQRLGDGRSENRAKRLEKPSDHSPFSRSGRGRSCRFATCSCSVASPGLSACFSAVNPGESGRNESDKRSVWFGMKLRPAPQGEELRGKTCEKKGDKRRRLKLKKLVFLGLMHIFEYGLNELYFEASLFSLASVLCK